MRAHIHTPFNALVLRLHILLSELTVVAHGWIGKEFPDRRQNERRIKFIRVGKGTVTGSISGWLPEEEPTLNRVLGPFLLPGCKELDRGLCRSFADWMRFVYWLRVREIKCLLPIWERRHYSAQEGLKILQLLQHGGGKNDKGLVFFFSCTSRLSLFTLFFHPWDTHLKYEFK